MVTNTQESDAALAAALAKLWPHREHESNAVLAVLCRAGFHLWRALHLESFAQGREVRYCFWCSKVRINGAIFDP